MHPANYKCTVGKIYQSTNERELRSRYVWTKKSEEIRERANYLCEVCRVNKVYTYDNLEVHHITKLSEDPNGLLEDDNLICLCVYHHKLADAGEIEKEYLRELIKEREK